MSANPPILAVPASVAEPGDRIERYRRNQLSYAVYHAELGKEEIKTVVGPDSFANLLPPTPNRSLVLAGGSSIGSTGSRSRGMVARMKPRNGGANQRPESTAFSCAPTELETPPPVQHSTARSLKEQIILKANPIPLQAKDLRVSAQSQADELVATGQGRKRRREVQIVSPGRHALLRQRLDRRRAKAAILNPKHQNPPNEGTANVVARQTDKTEHAVSTCDPGPCQVVRGAREGDIIFARSPFPSPLASTKPSRVPRQQGTKCFRPKGVDAVSHFRPGNVAGREGRITIKPRGVFNRGMTSGLFKVAQPEASQIFRAFSESRFFGQPPRVVSRAAGPRSASPISLSLPAVPDISRSQRMQAAEGKTTYVARASEIASVQGKVIHQTAVRECASLSPTQHKAHLTSLPNPHLVRSSTAPTKAVAPDAGLTLDDCNRVGNEGCHDGHVSIAGVPGLAITADFSQDQKLQPPPHLDQSRNQLLAASPSRPLAHHVSNRRRRRRTVPQLPSCRHETTPRFGSTQDGDLLGFLTAPQLPLHEIEDARLAVKEQEYLDELSLDSFEDKLFLPGETQVIPVSSTLHRPLLDIAEQEARALWRPRPI